MGPLIKILCEGCDIAQEQAAVALGMLADSSQNRDVIRKECGIQPLLRLLRNSSMAVQAGIEETLVKLAENRTIEVDAIGEAGSEKRGIQDLLEDWRSGNCSEQQSRAASAIENVTFPSQVEISSLTQEQVCTLCSFIAIAACLGMYIAAVTSRSQVFLMPRDAILPLVSRRVSDACYEF